MRKKKIIKKRVWIKINPINIAVLTVSILTGYVITSFNSSIQPSNLVIAKSENLVYSAVRIADAFESYNIKRFSQ